MYDPGGGAVLGGGGALGAGGLAATGFTMLAWIVGGIALLIVGLVLLRAASVPIGDEAAKRGRHRQ